MSEHIQRYKKIFIFGEEDQAKCIKDKQQEGIVQLLYTNQLLSCNRTCADWKMRLVAHQPECWHEVGCL